MMTDRVSQSTDSIIQNQQVLMLIFTEGVDESLQYVVKIRHQLSTGLFF